MLTENEFRKLESLIPEIHKANPNVSEKSVGWHVLHSLKVVNSILDALKKSDPDRYQKKFNFYRIVLFAFNRFPRGRAKSPKQVIPQQEEINVGEIRVLLGKARNELSSLDHHHPNAYFYHPYFGRLNVVHTRKFLLMHTEHHLKIIRDIIRAEAAGN